MNTLFLIRHSYVNPESARHELSAEGERRAIQFGEWLMQSSLPLPRIMYSSDRPRATQTAGYIAKGLGLGIGKVEMGDADQAVELLIPESCRKEAGLPLCISNKLEESNPPKEVEDSKGYVGLRSAGKRAALFVDWPGKAEKSRRYAEAVKKILAESECSLVVTHANALQQALSVLFPDFLDLAEFDMNTPHVSLTVLIKDGAAIKLNRLLYTEWGNSSAGILNP